MGRAPGVFARVLREVLPLIAAEESPPAPAGSMFRLGSVREGA
jgi:hypothetical protein